MIKQVASRAMLTAMLGLAGCSDSTPSETAHVGASANHELCGVLEFAQVAPFNGNENLFFTFDAPSEWAHKRASDGLGGHGYIHPRQNDRIGIEYLFMPNALNAKAVDGIQKMREATMKPLTAIEYDGQTVQVYTNSFPPNRSTVGFILPHRGQLYDAILNFSGPRDCGLEPVEHLRDIVVRSLAPNGASSFGG